MSGSLPITHQPASDATKTATLLDAAAARCLDNIAERRWSTSIFDCCTNAKQCESNAWGWGVLGCVCMPCMECFLADRMGECPGVACLPGGLLSMRVQMRASFGIKGSICNDCLITTFCQPCAICQMSRELDKVGL